MSDFPIINKVVEQHTDEIAFLYVQRKNSIVSPLYYLNEILGVDNRLCGHIAGLVLGGDTSWKYCEQNLAFEDIGEVFTAAIYSIVSKDFSKLDLVFEVAGENLALLDAIADAFIWSAYDDVKISLHHLMHEKDTERRYVAMAALSGHRREPDQYEQYIIESLSADSFPLSQCAWFSIGEMGMINLMPHLEMAMQSEDEAIRFAASWSATRLGKIQAMENLKKFVEHPLHGDRALQLIIMQKDITNTFEILKKLYQNAATQRRSISGLGYIGIPKSIPHLIEVMKTPALSRIAGEAVSTIAGIHLDQLGMVADAPEGFKAGPSENPEDEDVEIDPDEDLPWPDTGKISQWWQVNQQNFQPDQRYLLGHCINSDQLNQVLYRGNQKQRSFAASCLAFTQPNTPIFNTQWPAKYQIKCLEPLWNQWDRE